MKEKNEVIIINTALVLATTLMILVLLLRIFQWDLVHILTPFLMPFLVLFVYGISIIAVIIFIIICIRSFKKVRVYKSLILGLLVALILVSLFLPIDMYSENLRFLANFSKYNKAAKYMLENYDNENNTMLPSKYKSLSRGGGEVIIDGDEDNRIIMFFSFRGILDNFTVYAYVPNADAYETLESYEDWKEITCIKENWYLCISY